MTIHSPLLTDLYQLTMGAGYWHQGRAEEEAVFHLFFRKLPFGSAYAVAAGLGEAVEWLERLCFSEEELAYLGGLVGADGKALFAPEYIDYLRQMRWECDVEAIPEGTVVFPHEPLVRVKGPLIQAQLVETALLNIINFQTLIATKAARVCLAAQGEPVLEFGLRRAQGPEGALMASRAAYIGGCVATSNVLAGLRYGIPVKGTHAHSWVMSYETEQEAFVAYAEAMPNNALFLVDTYDTIEGVRHAIEVGDQLRERGHELVGIRLDSGDLAELSQVARRLLDEAGYPQASIVASNDLDEFLIESLKQKGAKITVWGVGTQMVTGGAQSALGGVYKLGAIRSASGEWQPRIKLSEQPIKVSNPGLQQVRRFSHEGKFIGDAIYDAEIGCPAEVEIMHPTDLQRSQIMPTNANHEDLLKPVYAAGKLIGKMPLLGEIRARTLEQLKQLSAETKRLTHPQDYLTGLEKSLHEQKMKLIDQLKKA
jgi:nicotinate phosphoribosyltransferase